MQRTTPTVIGLLCTIVACSVLLAGQGRPERPNAPRGGRTRVIVELNRQAIAADGVARMLSKLPEGTHRVARRYRHLPYVALEVNAQALAALANAGSDVVRVMDDAVLRPLLADSVPLIQANQVRAAGYDGSGMLIAIVDTGIDSTHPFLTGKVVEEACYSTTIAGLVRTSCPNGADEMIGPGAGVPCPMADCFHGTHVAGIAAGNGSTGAVAFSGVAPGAQLMSVQVFSEFINPILCGGSATCAGALTSDLLAGLERVHDVAATYNIASVNMSLGGGSFAAPCDGDAAKPIIDSLRALGIATVVAAGNSSGTAEMTSPACISSAVSVGSTTKADVVSYFSNVAPFMSLFAPGSSITSSVPGGQYGTFSGTSMAAPHVAGVWALLKQAMPTRSVSEILNAVQLTGLPIADTRAGGVTTAPRVRAFDALTTLTTGTNPPPTTTTLSPSHARVGTGIQLTVNGGGFTAGAVARWNGVDMPTTVVSTTKVQASIAASLMASPGTAQISVFTPAPGGGTSAPLTFTIDPPATLTPSATTVAPGSQVTVALANGYGGSTDWLALATVGAPDATYLQWTYVGAGTVNRTWTVTLPTTAGLYEFRLFLNNGFTRAATSAPIAIDSSINPLPIIGSLAPANAVVGGAAFPLVVNGSGFVATSIVRWNGVDRPTTFVSATRVQAAIAAADIAALGTAQVTVFSPTPGGGTSGPATFTIAPPPSLTVSPSSVAGGANITVTLTNGLGGGFDWIAFALSSSPNTTYVTWTFVGGGVTTRTWTVVAPPTAGTYEFRLFLNNGYTRAATSPPVTVIPGPNPVPVLTSMSPSGSPVGAAGFTIVANGTSFVQNSVLRWNGQDRPTTFVSAIKVQATIPATDLAAAGSANVTVFNPTPAGGVSAPLPFTIGGQPTLTPSTLDAQAGTPVTVTLADGYGGALDWIALAATGAPNSSFVQYTFVGAAVTNRTWTVNMPVMPGTYEFRLFLNNGYTRAATSAPITVQLSNPPTLTVSTTSAPIGTPVTVTLTNGLGGATDWLAFASTSMPNTSYVQYVWVGAGVTTRTWTVTLPALGTYEFRLFSNNSYTRLATSTVVTAQ